MDRMQNRGYAHVNVSDCALYLVVVAILDIDL